MFSGLSLAGFLGRRKFSGFPDRVSNLRENSLNFFADSDEENVRTIRSARSSVASIYSEIRKNAKEGNITSTTHDSPSTPFSPESDSLKCRRNSMASIASSIMGEGEMSPFYAQNDYPKKLMGTPDYLAPECISGSLQGPEVDWWALGVILYEFVVGIPPFHDSTPKLIFDKILQGKYTYPEEIELSEQCKYITSSFLKSDINERLGHYGSEEVKNHEYFSEIKWEGLLSQKSFFIPSVEKLDDTSYFDSRGLEQTKSFEINHLEEKDCNIDNSENDQDFGIFSFKNLNMCEKANQDIVKKINSNT